MNVEIIGKNSKLYSSPQSCDQFAKELSGLVKGCTFLVVLRSEVEDDVNILCSRFILCIKNIGTGEERTK